MDLVGPRRALNAAWQGVSLRQFTPGSNRVMPMLARYGTLREVATNRAASTWKAFAPAALSAGRPRHNALLKGVA